MKKLMFAVIAVLFLVGVSSSEETGSAKSVSGSVAIKSNWSKPEHGQGSFFQTVSLFIQTPSPLGLGGDFTYQPDGDYVEYAPYITVNSGPHYGLLGIMANNLGQDFIQFGYWHINTYAKLNVIADIRAYIGTNGRSKSYLDNYLEANYPVSKAVNVGLVVDDTYSFNGASNTFLAGPIAYGKISKSVTLIGRYLRAWTTTDAGSRQADNFRLAIQFSF